MLRKYRKKHEKENRNSHLNLYLAIIKILSKNQEKLTEGVKLHQLLFSLKDEQMKHLTEQYHQISEELLEHHNISSKLLKLLSESREELLWQHQQLVKRQEQLSEQHQKLSYRLLLLVTISTPIAVLLSAIIFFK